MKILLVSDTHGHDEIYEELYRIYPKMDLYLDAGDSESEQMFICPFLSVEGNCDYFPYDEKYRVYTPMGYLLMKHKPYFSREEIENNKFLIYGHLHCAKYFKKNDNIFICPGSTSFPRDNTDGTYIILDISDHECEVKIYSVKTKTILTCDKIR